MSRTHYLPKVGPPLDDGNWVEVAERDFHRPARCGRTVWSAATDKASDVDCRDCLAKMSPEERRGAQRRPPGRPRLTAAGPCGPHRMRPGGYQRGNGHEIPSAIPEPCRGVAGRSLISRA